MTGFNVWIAPTARTWRAPIALLKVAMFAVAALLGIGLTGPAADAQSDPTLSEALATSQRVPVIVVFNLPEFEADAPDAGLTDAAIDTRILRQRDIIERATGLPAATLSAPATQGAPGSQMRREFRSVAMVSMYLTGDEINALLADPSVSDVQLDRPVPPLTNGTIPLIGANSLHSGGLTGAGSTIAILDTGVDHEHPMFTGRIFESACFSSTVGADSTSLCPAGAASDTTTADAGDDCAYTGDTATAIAGCGHGTHVAGTAAGASFVDPGTGDTLIGVAPGANIVAVQVFSSFTGFCAGFGLPSPCALTYSSDQIAALDWIYTNRATLGVTSINMSLGGGRYTAHCNSDSRYTVINNLRTANIATVIASGNSSYDDAVGAPACIEPAIAVGATDDADVVAGFSNSATIIDLLAPGVAINSAEPTIDDTLPGWARSIQGTSMASPHVAGAFALLRAANPSASVQDIQTALENTGVSVTESPSGVVKPRIRVNLAHAALDTTAPRITSIVRQTPSGSPTNADSVTWRVTFDEAVSNVTADDFMATGTTGTIAVNNVSTTLTDVTVSGGDMAGLNGTATLGFAGGQNIADIAGNALANTTPTGTNDNTFTLDNTAPRLDSISGLQTYTHLDAITFRATFDETVLNVSTGDFTITGTTATVTNVSAISGTVYDLTVSGGDLAAIDNTTVSAAIAGGHDITDAAGGALTNTTAVNGTSPIFVNNTPPVGTFSSAATSPVNGDFTVSLDFTPQVGFADNILGLVQGDIVVSNATIESFTFKTGGGGVTTGATMTVRPAGSGAVTLDLPANSVIDEAENPNPAAAQFSMTADLVAPRIASIERFSPTIERASNDLVRWRVTFSETVSNVTADDFTVAGTTGTLSVSNTTTTTVDLDLSGGDMAGLDGTVTLGVAGGQNITDTAGNALTNATPTGANDNTFVMDNTPPRVASVVRQTSTNAFTNADSITWRVTFNEDVTGVDATKFGLTVPFDVNAGTISQTVTPVSASIYDVTASGGDLIAMNGDVTLRIFTTVNDVAFNTMTNATPTGTSELTYTVDNLPIDISGIYRITPAGEKTNADTLVWIAAADLSSATEAGIDAATVSAGDFALTGPTGATLSVSVENNFNDGSARITVTASGGDLASYNGTATLGLAGGSSILDLAGNTVTTSLAQAVETFDVRNTAPSLASIARLTPAAAATNADSITWRLTFAQIDGTFALPANAFTVTGTTGTVTEVSRFSIGFDVTVSGGDLASLDGPVTLGLTNTDVLDDYGNVMDRTIPAGAEITFTIDNTPPSLAITGPGGAVSGAFTATFTFSEDATGFDQSDITVGNGTLSNFAATNAQVYTATITPAADGAVTVDVAAAAAQDAAGNNSTAANQLSVTNDATAPAVTNVEFVTTGGTPTSSDTLMWAIALSEGVTNVSADDFAVTGTTATVTNVDTPQSTVVVVTASGGDLAGLNGNVTLALSGGSDLSDAAGNRLADLTVQSGGNDQRTVAVDNTAPVLERFARDTPADQQTDADNLVFGIRFNEVVTNVSADDFVITGTTATGVIAGSGTSYTLTVSGGNLANLNGTVGLDLAAGQNIADAAGNALPSGEPATDHTYSVLNDTVAPRVASILRAAPTELNPTGSDSLHWRVTFDEAVTGVDAGDFTVTGTTGTVSTVSAVAVALPPSVSGASDGPVWGAAAVSQSTYQITVSGGDLASLNGLVTLGFAPGQNIADAAGNALVNTVPTGANINTFNVDNSGPAVTVSSSAAMPVRGPFTVSIRFAEPVSGFEAGDLVVGNGTASNLVIIPDNINGWPAGFESYFDITITPAGEGNVTVNIGAGVSTDIAGNPNAAATQFSIAHDPNRTLTVSLPGVGSGTVTSAPGGIDCGVDCTQSYTVGTPVTLTAAADTGSSFAGWTAGPCAGSATASCAVTMNTDQAVAARFTLDTPPAGRIVAATLPGARSGYVGGPVMSAFLSVVSRTTSPAQSCRIEAPAGAPVTLTYRQLDTSGAPTEPENPLFDIAPGGTLNFVIAMTATTQTGAGGYSFLPVIACQNASLDPIVGVNDVLLNIGAAPTPDILSISSTPSGDGVIRIANPGGVGVITAAAVNIGAGDGSGGPNDVTLTVTSDTGAASLPVTTEICQINAAAACVTARGTTVTVPMTQNTPLFFAAFVRDTSGGAGIAFVPANARVFLRFADASGTVRSATSAAVTAPAAADIPETAATLPVGRWSVLVRQPEGVWPGLARASLYVSADGTAILDDGRAVRSLNLTLPASAPAEGAGNIPARFEAGSQTGAWTRDGAIRLGAPWAEQIGEFWGVRDTRSDVRTSWGDFAGSFGDSLTLSLDGELRGTLDGCIVYGQASGPVTRPATLTISGCADAGTYAAVLDTPANDNAAPALLIAKGDTGWREERRTTR